jgi:hypothetical protein
MTESFLCVAFLIVGMLMLFGAKDAAEKRASNPRIQTKLEYEVTRNCQLAGIFCICTAIVLAVAIVW